MSYDPRSIAFCAEIIYPPQQLHPDRVQSVHNALYRQAPLSYQNFQVAPDGIHLSNLPQAPGQVSVASFLPDRFLLREELRGTSVEDFATRIVNIATTSFDTLGITASLAQQFVIRSLISPRNFRDGRDFLMQRLIGPGGSSATESWSRFGRPLQALGARFVFPPHESRTETYHVRVESWPQDPQSIWIENTGSFAGPIQTADVPRLANHLYSTYRFLTGPVSSFLADLDTP
ncbi:MAG: hypothetical protein KDC98_04165 [Planctomycetes bacterium]|nr:hypothetical protein [Planctomycetota bacterium]